MSLGEGAVFAGFVVQRLLGSGGMGQVYLVRHPRLPRQEALKILPADMSGDHDFRARFIREADLAASLFHPHIVGVHDRGEFHGQLWISMDYVEGTDLAQLIRDRYPAGMPAAEAIPIIAAIADALDYAHHRGLLHRDVKPANILIGHPDEHGQPRILLTDFGIARPTDDISGLTATNMTLGTVAYAAPEQLMGAPTDARADQYALAATAYYLLTGTRLYPHSNPVAVISAHLASAPPLLSQHRPELASLDGVFAAALAKDPASRFPSCRAFAQTMAGYTPQLRSAPVEPTVAAVPPRYQAVGLAVGDRGAATQRPRRRGRTVLIAAVVGVVVLIAGGAVLGARVFSGGTEVVAQSPGDAADREGARLAGQQYLQALAAGDARTALSLAAHPPTDTRFLTDDVLRAQLAALPITDITATNAPPAPQDDPTRVQSVVLAATFGSAPSRVRVALERGEGGWKLRSASVPLLLGSPGAAAQLAVWKVPTEGAATVDVFPGAVSIGSAIRYVDIAAEVAPLLLDSLVSHSRPAIQTTVTLSDAGRQAVPAAITDWVHGCYRGVAPPAYCPGYNRNSSPNVVPDTASVTGDGDFTAVTTTFDAASLSVLVTGTAVFQVTSRVTSGSPSSRFPIPLQGRVDLVKDPPVFTFTAPIPPR
jgi:hypothetical protein